MPDYKHNNTLRSQLSKKLQQFSRVEKVDQTLTRAAVAVTISAQSKNDQSCILLTRRSSKLRKHAGQYALPGGKLDEGETLTEAALRELSEELGLNARPENVIGILDDFPTQSGFCITPVVVWIENHVEMNANADEVAAVFEVTLKELAELTLGASEEEDDTPIEPGADIGNTNNNTEKAVMSVYLPGVGTTVYSPTAAIIYQFREVALAGRSTRVAHFGQPKFAWK